MSVKFNYCQFRRCGFKILFSALYSNSGSCDGKDDLIGSDYAGGDGATFYNPCTFDPECTNEEEEDDRIALGKFR